MNKLIMQNWRSAPLWLAAALESRKCKLGTRWFDVELNNLPPRVDICSYVLKYLHIRKLYLSIHICTNTYRYSIVRRLGKSNVSAWVMGVGSICSRVLKLYHVRGEYEIELKPSNLLPLSERWVFMLKFILYLISGSWCLRLVSEFDSYELRAR